MDIIANFIVFDLLYTRKEQLSKFVCIPCVDLNRISLYKFTAVTVKHLENSYINTSGNVE